MAGASGYCDIDLAAPGRRVGTLRVTHSDNRHAFGHVSVPVAIMRGHATTEDGGPTVLLVAGNHGDEYEGQAILLSLLHTLDPRELRGRIIMFPALNAPAVAAGSRVSPLDQVNMNRAFLAGAPPGPTRAIAAFVESLLPECAGVLDLHSGGSTSIYMDAALATRTPDDALFARNMAMARALGLPIIQVLGGTSTGHSLNSAAAAVGVPMAATELGGGGRTSRASVAAGRRGVLNVLRHCGVLPGEAEDFGGHQVVQVTGPRCYVVVPGAGVLEPIADLGDQVAVGDAVAVLHHWREPDRPPRTLLAEVAGTVIDIAARGLVQAGDHAAMIGEPFKEAS